MIREDDGASEESHCVIPSLFIHWGNAERIRVLLYRCFVYFSLLPIYLALYNYLSDTFILASLSPYKLLLNLIIRTKAFCETVHIFINVDIKLFLLYVRIQFKILMK